jgi:hypothetical protein
MLEYLFICFNGKFGLVLIVVDVMKQRKPCVTPTGGTTKQNNIPTRVTDVLENGGT